MANNLIRVKQLDQPELSGLVQNVIESNEFTLTYGGTGININNVGLITISGTDINFINGNINISGDLTLNGTILNSGIRLANMNDLTATGSVLYTYINQLSGDFDTSGAILNSYINNLSGDFNQTGALLNNYINDLSGVSVLRYGNQTISGVKTFVDSINVSGTGIFNSVDLNNIDILSLSGVDITITSGNVILTNPVLAPNLVYNTGNQTISGVKTFANSGIFSLANATQLTLPNNPLSIVGSGNSYIQVNVQNRATGLFATADLVITNNNGTDITGYINLGINNSGYNDPSFSNGIANDGYLFVNGGNLDIGTQTTGTAVEFHIGGTTLNRTIARITSSGLNILSGNLTVGNTGVLLSGQNSFIMQASTSQSNFNDANRMYFFMGNGAGYTTSRLDRPTPFLEACTVKKTSFQLNQAAAAVVANNVTGFFINTTKNLTGIIFSGVSTTADGNFYHYVNNNLNMPFSEGDSGVFAVYTTTVGSTNVRSIATLYCYN